MASIIKDVQIRILSENDYDDIISLWERAGQKFIKPKGRDSRDSISCEIKQGSGTFIGAYLEGKLIGITLVTNDGRKGWMNRLAVDKEFRRQGLAMLLTSEGEKYLREEKGIFVFGLLVDAWNTSSIRQAEKAGYVLHKDIYYLSKHDSDDA